jgi:hypothetical protein
MTKSATSGFTIMSKGHMRPKMKLSALSGSKRSANGAIAIAAATMSQYQGRTDQSGRSRLMRSATEEPAEPNDGDTGKRETEETSSDAGSRPAVMEEDSQNPYAQ